MAASFVFVMAAVAAAAVDRLNVPASLSLTHYILLRVSVIVIVTYDDKVGNFWLEVCGFMFLTRDNYHSCFVS